jgi:hypothetical protein
VTTTNNELLEDTGLPPIVTPDKPGPATTDGGTHPDGEPTLPKGGTDPVPPKP